MTIVNAKTINLSFTTYQNNKTITNIDLNYCPFSGNSAFRSFENCNNLLYPIF